MPSSPDATPIIIALKEDIRKACPQLNGMFNYPEFMHGHRLAHWILDEVVSYVAALRERCEKAEVELEGLNELFDLQYKRLVVATKLWQKAHNQPHTLPDLGKLIDWLLEARHRLQDIVNLDSENPDAEASFTAMFNACAYLNPQDYPGLIGANPQKRGRP